MDQVPTLRLVTHTQCSEWVPHALSAAALPTGRHYHQPHFADEKSGGLDSGSQSPEPPRDLLPQHRPCHLHRGQGGASWHREEEGQLSPVHVGLGVYGTPDRRGLLGPWLWSLGDRAHSGTGDGVRRAQVGFRKSPEHLSQGLRVDRKGAPDKEEKGPRESGSGTHWAQKLGGSDVRR